eukprot:scaffold9559_cov101-Isochrysis_galbana.AAC.8
MAAGMARACRRRRAKNSIGSANNSTHSRCECEELHYNKEEREGPQHSQPKPKASIDADGGLRMVGHVFVRARLSFGLGAWVHAGSFEVVSVGTRPVHAPPRRAAKAPCGRRSLLLLSGPPAYVLVLVAEDLLGLPQRLLPRLRVVVEPLDVGQEGRGLGGWAYDRRRPASERQVTSLLCARLAPVLARDTRKRLARSTQNTAPAAAPARGAGLGADARTRGGVWRPGKSPSRPEQHRLPRPSPRASGEAKSAAWARPIPLAAPRRSLPLRASRSSVTAETGRVSRRAERTPPELQAWHRRRSPLHRRASQRSHIRVRCNLRRTRGAPRRASRAALTSRSRDPHFRPPAPARAARPVPPGAPAPPPSSRADPPASDAPCHRLGATAPPPQAAFLSRCTLAQSPAGPPGAARPARAGACARNAGTSFNQQVRRPSCGASTFRLSQHDAFRRLAVRHRSATGFALRNMCARDGAAHRKARRAARGTRGQSKGS